MRVVSVSRTLRGARGHLRLRARRTPQLLLDTPAARGRAAPSRRGLREPQALSVPTPCTLSAAAATGPPLRFQSDPQSPGSPVPGRGLPIQGLAPPTCSLKATFRAVSRVRVPLPPAPAGQHFPPPPARAWGKHALGGPVLWASPVAPRSPAQGREALPGEGPQGAGPQGLATPTQLARSPPKATGSCLSSARAPCTEDTAQGPGALLPPAAPGLSLCHPVGDGRRPEAGRGARGAHPTLFHNLGKPWGAAECGVQARGWGAAAAGNPARASGRGAESGVARAPRARPHLF